MKKILVATDGSASSNRAVSRAVELAKQAQAEITFVNVGEPRPINMAYRQLAEVELGGPVRDPAAFLPLLETFPGLNSIQAVEALDTHGQAVAQLVSDRVLDDAERVAAAAGLHGVKKVSAVGDAANEIVATAQSAGADLVVVGRRGLSEVAELVLGSVSQKVLHRLKTNVLVVS